MLGITLDGAAVEVDRGGRPILHALTDGTVSEVRSTFVHALRAAGRPWGDIAEVMRCTRPTARADAVVAPLRLHPGGRLDGSLLATASIPDIRAMFAACLRGADRSWRTVAFIMRCSVGTAKRDANPQAVRHLHREALAHAG